MASAYRLLSVCVWQNRLQVSFRDVHSKCTFVYYYTNLSTLCNIKFLFCVLRKDMFFLCYVDRGEGGLAMLVFCLTSWVFIVSLLDIYDVHTPLHENSQSVCACGLTSWGFIVKKKRQMACPYDILKFERYD